METIQGIPVDKYFEYHPPQTEERRRKHEINNTACLQLFYKLSKTDDPQIIRESLREFNALMSHLLDDHLTRSWALKSLELAGQSALSQDRESVLMCIQQVRMFVNQGITIDELKPYWIGAPLS